MTLQGRSFLFIIDHLSSGGAQQQMVLLARQFVRAGNEVQFLTYRPNDFHAETFRESGIPVEVVQRESKYSMAFVQRVAEKLRTEPIDGVLSFLTGPNLYALLGRWRSRRKTPVVVSERTSANNPSIGLFHNIAEKTYRFADAIVVNSHHFREHLQTKYPKLAPRIQTIWNGVDLDRFRPTPLPEADSALSFVAVGQLGVFKQPEVVIRALADLRDRHGVRATLTWFARRFPNLTQSEQSYKSKLDVLIKDLSLENQWCWQPETNAIENELPRFHALIHASIVEGLPNAICEALASGRPVLASKTLDHPRLVIDAENGLLFDKSSHVALADVMIKFCRYKANERQALGDQASVFAKEFLSPAAFGEQYLELFQKLC